MAPPLKTRNLRKIGPKLYEYKGILLRRKPVKYFNNELHWVAEMKVHFMCKSLKGLVIRLNKIGIKTPAEKAKIKPVSLEEMLKDLPDGVRDKILKSIEMEKAKL